MNIKILPSLIFVMAAFAADADTYMSPSGKDVKFLVCGQQTSSDVVYEIKVNNNSSTPVSGFIIGLSVYNAAPKDGSGKQSYVAIAHKTEITSPPVAYDLDSLTLDQSSFQAPPGWTANIWAEEDNPAFGYYFKATNDDGSLVGDPIAKNSTQQSFKLHLKKVDPSIMHADVTVRFSGSNNEEQSLGPSQFQSSLLPDDRSAPSIRFNFTPSILTPALGQMVPVVANITVTDDCDPQPTIKLVSLADSDAIAVSPSLNMQGFVIGTDSRSYSLRALVSPNISKSRTYTAVYSATDSAGNSTSSTNSVGVNPLIHP